MSDQAEETPSGGRVLSIDVLRGFVVLLMLFVNEVAGVRGAPSFLRHMPRDADGMTITDVVFPAFLFIAGMAIPFALDARRRKGETPRQVLLHLAGRSTALLVVGVLMVNDEHGEAGGFLGREVWSVLLSVGVLLAWSVPRAGRAAPLRALGFALLAFLVVTYRTPDVQGPIYIRPYWWGILGLIGWAYLVAGGIYLAAGRRPGVLVGAIALLYCVCLADEAGDLSWLALLRPYLSLGRLVASHAAITVSGVVLSVLLVALRDSSWVLIRSGLAYAAALASAGALLHSLHGLDPAFRVSKILATVPWCLLSSAATCAAWLAAFLLVDVLQVRRWPPAVTMAGENALVAYVLAPALLSVFALTAPWSGGRNFYEALSEPVWLGLLRSAVFAWVVVRACGVLRSRGLVVRL